jgi:hypothetical protein
LRFATVTVIGSGRLLSSDEILPMLGTLGQSFGFASELPLGPELALPPINQREFPAKPKRPVPASKRQTGGTNALIVGTLLSCYVGIDFLREEDGPLRFPRE